MADRRLPVPAARRRPGGLAQSRLPQAYSKRLRHRFTDLYDSDHAEQRREGRFRWLISTCLAGAVGATAILVVIYGSADTRETGGGFLSAIQPLRQELNAEAPLPSPQRVPGLAWIVPKGDRLMVDRGMASTRYIVQDSIKERRAGRDYIKVKPYARIVARLAAVPPKDADAIPPFNPLKLYANAEPAGGSGAAAARNDVSIRVADIPGGRLPTDDKQELDARDAAAIVARFQAETAGQSAGGPGRDIDTSRDGTDGAGGTAQAQTPYTTEIAKTSGGSGTDADGPPEEDAEGAVIRESAVQAGDTLERALARAGAEAAQVRRILADVPGFPDAPLMRGQTLRLELVPSLGQPGKMDISRVSLYAPDKSHIITAARDAGGTFELSPDGPPGERVPLSLASRDQAPASSVYAAVYHAGLLQGLSPAAILTILRVHAYETDFRRRVHPGDSAEFFFDMKENAPPESPPGELLFSAITTAGETVRFYRFRTHDGIVDYYDENGNNAKKFLTIKPVRGSEVRLTSGFGKRFHPLLKVMKPHTGIDWAAPPGTPILAAGNGVIEEAGHKGGYGNYVRIRHANGYQTTYGHLSRFAEGLRPKIKVKQGMLIGYVGTTGLSSGPHLHFEVLVNNRFVDPVSIKIPRERQLTGRDLAEFNKERGRIEDLARRPAVYASSK